MVIFFTIFWWCVLGFIVLGIPLLWIVSFIIVNRNKKKNGYTLTHSYNSGKTIYDKPISELTTVDIARLTGLGMNPFDMHK